jgi:hypothetical protein
MSSTSYRADFAAAPHPLKPWYRYFWPWLVIALLSSAVIGSLISAYLAVHTQDRVLEHAQASE